MDDRLNSMMIWNNANNFFEAAQILRKEKQDIFFPTYFLLGQSIELSLKGFLRGTGASEKDLKNLGHDLNKALQKAEKRLQSLANISHEDKEIIDSLNVYYKSKDLQYTLTGFKRLPIIDDVFDVAKKLLNGTKSHCRQNKKQHFGKPTAVFFHSSQSKY